MLVPPDSDHPVFQARSPCVLRTLPSTGLSNLITEGLLLHNGTPALNTLVTPSHVSLRSVVVVEISNINAVITLSGVRHDAWFSELSLRPTSLLSNGHSMGSSVWRTCPPEPVDKLSSRLVEVRPRPARRNFDQSV